MAGIDMTGKRFGRLVVLRRGESSKFGQWRWICQCDCGNVSLVEGRQLRDGKTKSCGCLHREMVGKKFRKHGGANKEPLYSVWRNMVRRTGDPKDRYYHIYGGRGIQICEAWKDYAVFRDWAVTAGYAKGLSIDRIDVNGDYEPGNCRWVTPKIQSRNTRFNRHLTARGETHCVAEWEEILGTKTGTIEARLLRHPDMPHEEILFGDWKKGPKKARVC